METNQARHTVISVRVDGPSLQAIDLLVKAGLAQSRSEAAAQFVAMGIRSADQLLAKAAQLADSMQQLKGELLSAIKARDVASAKAVLEQNPELLRAWTREGETPLMLSVYAGANELTQWLLERGAEMTPFEAVAVGDAARVGQFLAADPALLRARNHNGWTVLHMAAYFGHAEIVRLLLDHGADVKERSTNEFNNTPLHSALAGRRYVVARLFVERGADVDSQNGRGWTPLHLAAGAGDLDTVTFLLEHGARIDIRNTDGLAPAEIARERGYPAVADLLQSIPARATQKTRGVRVKSKGKR
jgi:uncharacterized protein